MIEAHKATVVRNVPKTKSEASSINMSSSQRKRELVSMSSFMDVLLLKSAGQSALAS